MNLFSRLLELACGKPPEAADEGRAGRMALVVSAMLASLVFAALWGAAAGSKALESAGWNVIKVPMIVLLSAIVALPAGLLVWKLSGAPGRARDMLLAFSSGTLAGCLVLAVSAPFVALYYWTSKWGGPIVGQSSTILALIVGTVIFIRSAVPAGPGELAKKRGAVALPVMVLLVAQIASIAQLIALFSPIFPEHTHFDGGIDNLARKEAR